MVKGDPAPRFKSKVFLVSAELGADCSKLRADGYAGGFVTVIVTADHIRAAIDKSEHALEEDGYEEFIVDRAFVFDPDEWQDNEEILNSVSETMRDNEARYTTFHVWGH